MSEENIFATDAYKALKDSDEGKALVKRSEADAASFMFYLQSGDKNKDVAKVLTANEIYDAVILSSSLSFEVDGHNYEVQTVLLRAN